MVVLPPVQGPTDTLPPAVAPRPLPPDGKPPKEHVNAIEYLDREIEACHAQLVERREARSKAEERLRKARLKEQQDNSLRRQTDVTNMRRHEMARKIQAVLRGFLVRRFVATTMRMQVQVKSSHGDREVLHDQIQSLQHNVHDLVFQSQEKARAVTTIQLWWRAVCARRLVQVIKVVKAVRHLQRRLEAAATVIQSCYRGHRARLQYFELIREVTEASRRRMVLETERHWCCVLLVQRAIRSYLARKEAEKRREKLDAFGLQDPENDWKLALAKTAPASLPWPKPPVEPSHKKRAEFENLHNNGLIPFYWTATEVVRHKIGGHAWLGRPHSRPGPSRSARTGGGGTEAAGEIAELYDVYPEGISEDFHSLVRKADAEITRPKGKPSSKGPRRPRRGAKKTPAAPLDSRFTEAPKDKLRDMQELWKGSVPSHSEKRAQVRASKTADQERGFESDPDEESRAIEEDTHPLLFFSKGPLPMPAVALD